MWMEFLTDGSLIISETGELLRTMNVKDGFAMKFAIDNGYKIGIISGGTNEAVKKRLNNLGIEEIHLRSHDKIIHFNNFLTKYDLSNEDILVMGDDIPDIPIIKAAGVGCCPQDATFLKLKLHLITFLKNLVVKVVSGMLLNR